MEGSPGARSNFVADFETTTDPDDCRVWGWGFCAIRDDVTTDDVVVGTTIESFLKHISTMKTNIYFHNLGFDGSFILDWMLKNGYRHVDKYPRKGEFTTLISNKNQFYSITVKWISGGITEFRDSLKKLSLSIAATAKAFDMEMSKLEIDYHEYRAPDHVLTDEEVEYIAHDVVIPARAMARQLSEGMTKLTVGADSLAEYKKLMGGSKMFERIFPILAESMDADIRKAYRGGWTYCDPRTQAKVVGPGAVYDVNSLYPSVMFNELLPYGEPKWFQRFPEPDDEYPLWIASLTFTAKIKPDHVPCIQVKGSGMFVSTEYLTEIVEPVTLSITNVDLELWEKHYDLDILSWNGGWKFKATTGLFDDYVNKWMHIKNTTTGGLRHIAKLHLNSLYGKFATNPDVTGKVPTLKDDTLKLVEGQPETRNPVYTAMGVFITAYARHLTISAAQANYATFAYADTDSLHLLTLEPPIDVVVGDELGEWAHEYNFETGMFWRAKTYSEQEPGGRMHTHIAGMPPQVAKNITFDDYRDGASFSGKLLQKRVPGGIILEDTTFTLLSGKTPTVNTQ